MDGCCRLWRRNQANYEIVRKVGRGKYSEVWKQYCAHTVNQPRDHAPGDWGREDHPQNIVSYSDTM
jgi:hypothetical protein